MKKERKKYEKEHKTMIVGLIESGQSASMISNEYGLNESMVRRWRKENNDDKRSSFTGNGNSSLTPEQEENRRLKKELKEALIEREILKKAAVGDQYASSPRQTGHL